MSAPTLPTQLGNHWRRCHAPESPPMPQLPATGFDATDYFAEVWSPDRQWGAWRDQPDRVRAMLVVAWKHGKSTGQPALCDAVLAAQAAWGIDIHQPRLPLGPQGEQR